VRPKLIIMDLFGTLYRWVGGHIISPAHFIWLKCSDPTIYDLANIIRQIDGHDGELISPGPLTEKEFRDIQLDRWRSAFEHCGIFPSARMLALCDRVIERRRISLYPDAVRFLEWIRSIGIPWGICSNASPDVLPKLLEQLPKTVSRPAPVALSCTVGALKPHIRMYEALEMPEQGKDSVLFVGDRPGADVVGPLAFGFSAVHLARSGNAMMNDRLVDDQFRDRYLGAVTNLDDLWPLLW
jgi:FMN phosphatase YigB (HAD superfamily)